MNLESLGCLNMFPIFMQESSVFSFKMYLSCISDVDEQFCFLICCRIRKI